MDTNESKTKEELGDIAVAKLNESLPDGATVRWSCAHSIDEALGIRIYQPLLSISFTNLNNEAALREFNAVKDALPDVCKDLILTKVSTEKLTSLDKIEYCHSMVIILNDLISHNIFNLKNLMTNTPPPSSIPGPVAAQTPVTMNLLTKEEIKTKLLASEASATQFFNEINPHGHNVALQKILLEITQELKQAQKEASDELNDAIFKKWINDLENLDVPAKYLKEPLQNLNEFMSQQKISPENQEEAHNIYHKYHAISSIKNAFKDSQREDANLKTVVQNLYKAGKTFEDNREHLEKERHPFIRKMFYKASHILLGFGIGVITSVICAIHSKLTVGTFDYLKALEERRTTSKSKAEKALKTAGIPAAQLKKPGAGG